VDEIWDTLVLLVTLLAAAGIAILALAFLVFDSPPPGLVRARPYVGGLVGLALGLLVLEWTVVH
jgi:hypothetical protein